MILALGFAGLSLLLLSMSVSAQSYGPPYVIGVRQSRGETTQLANSAAVDSEQGYAYVLTQNTVVVLSNTQVFTTFSVGNPLGIETVAGYAYVPLADERMRLIQGDQLLTTIIELDADAGALATNPQSGQAYLTLPDEGKVAIFDGVLEVARVATGQYPVALAVDPDHEKIYVANRGDPSLATVDLTGSTTVSTLPLPVTPTKVTVNPKTQYVYVATQDDSVLVVPGGSGIQETISIPSPGEMAVNPNTGRVYVLSAPLLGTGVVVEVLSGDQRVDRIELNHPDWALTNAIKVNESSGYVYVAAGRSRDKGVVAIISDTHLIEVIPVAQTPMDVAVAGVDESEQAYVPIYDRKIVVFGRAETYGTGPISGGSGFTTTLDCYGTNNLPIQIDIPAEAIDPTVGDVEVTCAALPQNPVGTDFVWAGQGYRISVLQDGTVLPDFEFEVDYPPRVIATYDEEALGGGSEAAVHLRYQSGTADNPAWETTGIETLGKAPALNQISATFRYPGSYAVVTDLSGVFLPLVMR
jgi:DNA-binding beta-propeller fold protein YncE